MKTQSPVTQLPTATPEQACAHFQSKFLFETDCSDVHQAIERGDADFILLDVRNEQLYRAGHVPTARHLPHSKITRETLPSTADEAIYVVYCAGPHCNGAHKAALKIAQLGLPVKEMIGGIEGWKDEGYELVTGER